MKRVEHLLSPFVRRRCGARGRVFRLTARLAALTAGLNVALTRAADQPQWGELFSRNMVSSETGLPESFDPATGRHVRWIAEIGTETHATPIVAGGRVYIGTNNGRPRDPRHVGDRGVLMCLDERTGALLWQWVVPKITTSIYWDWTGSGVCSPPTVEGDRVYAVSSRGEVVCLDADGMANGNDGPFLDEARYSAPAGKAQVPPAANDADILWRYDMIAALNVRQHDAAHCSLLLHGRFLYANTSNGVDDTHRHIASPDAPCLIVIDKETGRLVARDDERIGPDIFHCTWSSPALITVNGRTLILYAAPNGMVYAFEPVTQVTDRVQTLKKVWWFDCDPSAPKGQVHRFVANRKESPSTIHAMPVLADGRLYVAGGGDIWWGKREAWLLCLDPAAGSGDVTATARLWSYPLLRHTLSTPAVWNGLAFAADMGRTIHCVDAATGRACWTHEIQGEMWASPLVADSKVYIGTRRGEFTVLAAAREKKVLATIMLDGPVSGSPVAANSTLYVPTQRRLYALSRTQNVGEK